MQQSCRTLVLFSLFYVTQAAKTRSSPIQEATALSRQHSEGRLFTIFHRQSCTGIPYTKDESNSCDGFTAMTEESCEMKCAQNAQAPNCPQETCHAAVFYPASGVCHLFNDCKTVEPSIGSVTLMDQEMLAQEQGEEQALDAEGRNDDGPTAELMTAIPMCLMNATNFSNMLHSQSFPRDENITLRFGNYERDIDVLYDKISGFLLALHDRMNPGDGPKYCPFKNESVIDECLTVATCIVQRAVQSNEISMEAFSAIMEQVARFHDVGWPNLAQGLISEGHDKVHRDIVVPEQYRCDGMHEADPHSLVAPALIQIEATSAKSAHAETLAMSAALRQATASTHKILDAHRANSSMHATGSRLEKVWRGVCKKLPCDASNMFDVILAGHKQSAALFQTGAVAHLRLEIQQRVKLYHRLQFFVGQHYNQHVTFFRSGILLSSEEAARSYGNRGREALIKVAVPYMERMSQIDAEHAIRLVDHVELMKFIKDTEEREGADKLRASKGSPHALLDIGEDRGEDHDEEVTEEDAAYNTDDDQDTGGKEGESFLSVSSNSTAEDAGGSQHWCIGKTITMWNHKRQRYVRMADFWPWVQTGDHQYRDKIPFGWTWERFQCVDAGGGDVAFYNPHFHRFLKLDSFNDHRWDHRGWMTRSPEKGAHELPSGWTLERFRMKDFGGGHWGLYNRNKRKYMEMTDGAWQKEVKATHPVDFNVPGHWNTESMKFYFQETQPAPVGQGFWFVGKTVALWSHHHQRYARMNSNKHGKYMERSPNNDGWKDPMPGGWAMERFVPEYAGGAQVGFFNPKYGCYLRMRDGWVDAKCGHRQGDLHEGMTWERFTVLGFPDGHFAFYNEHHRRFLKMTDNAVTASGKVDIEEMPKTGWPYELFYIQDVGKACGWACKLRRGIGAVTNFVKGLFECFAQFSLTESVGYTREIPGQPIGAGINIGMSDGVNVNSLKQIIQGKLPSISTSVWASFTIGGVAKWIWTGSGVSVWFSAGTTGLHLGVSIGLLATGWSQAIPDAKCLLGPLFAGMECSRSIGFVFSMMCCSFDLINAKNNCR